MRSSHDAEGTSNMDVRSRSESARKATSISRSSGVISRKNKQLTFRTIVETILTYYCIPGHAGFTLEYKLWEYIRVTLLCKARNEVVRQQM